MVPRKCDAFALLRGSFFRRGPSFVAAAVFVVQKSDASSGVPRRVNRLTRRRERVRATSEQSRNKEDIDYTKQVRLPRVPSLRPRTWRTSGFVFENKNMKKRSLELLVDPILDARERGRILERQSGVRGKSTQIRTRPSSRNETTTTVGESQTSACAKGETPP